MRVIPSDQEEQMILAEVRDHATYWHSDRCKRGTVEAHLRGEHAGHPGRMALLMLRLRLIGWLFLGSCRLFLRGLFLRGVANI